MQTVNVVHVSVVGGPPAVERPSRRSRSRWWWGWWGWRGWWGRVRGKVFPGTCYRPRFEPFV